MKFSLHGLLTAIGLCWIGVASAQQLAWHTALGADGKGWSEFVAVEALAESGAGAPARAWYAGNFEGDFKFGGLADDNTAGPSGLVVRMSQNEYDLWGSDWMARAESVDSVEFTDLAISESGGLAFVCGTFRVGVTFIDAEGTELNSVVLSSIGETDDCGFVAILDGETGAWLSAYATLGIQPVSLVAEADGAVVVTGSGTLAAKYSPGGILEWSSPALAGMTRWAHVAVGPDPADPNLYVLCEDGGDAASQTVVLWQLSRANGAAGWSRRMGSAGVDTAGGLDVGPQGDVRLSYSANDQAPLFEGQPVEGVLTGDEAVLAEYTVVARVRPDGAAVWVAPVGHVPNWDAKMRSYDIDVDPVGNAWIAVMVGQAYEISDKWVGFADDTIALVSVDGAGVVHDLHYTYGRGAKLGPAVAAPARDLVFSGGSYIGKKTQFDPLPNLSDPGVRPGAYAAVLKPVSSQQLWVFHGLADAAEPMTLPQLRRVLRSVDIKTYVETGMDGHVAVVTGYATNEQVELVTGSGNVTAELEVEMAANGVVSDSGWALARLGDVQAQAPWSYTSPETANEVVLYLIDTAVTNPGGWFDGNANLTIGESTLIRGTGDPTVSSVFGHGTRMLSLIAGPETGAAQGTPIRVVNYDIYPDGGTTTATLVSKAILEAAQRHQQEPAGTPGVVCLATSSQTAGSSLTLQMAVDYAVNAGLPVVVSAGNSGQDASAFIPAGYGIDGGVICVGASNAYNQRTAISNFGSAVDLYAPGENVNVLRFDAPASGVYDLSNGTSPATALTAAAALVELSQDPRWEPEEVEKVMLDSAAPGTVLANVSLSDTSTTVASDDFASGGFSGGTGWVGSWAASGTVTIKENLMNLAFAGTSATRTVDLSAYSSAQLGFHMQTFENGDDTWVVEANDGTGWVIVETIAPSGAGTVVERNEQKIYQLHNHISLSSTVQVRFRIIRGYGQTGIQYVNLDDVVITASGGGGGGTTRLVQMGPYGVVIGPPVQTEFEMWAAAQGLAVAEPTADSDGDGTVDLLEFVQGSDPLMEEEPARTITYQPGSDEISYGFEVNPVLFDASNPKTLLDGTGWEIQFSDDMVSWETVSGELTFGATDEGRVLVTMAVLPETPQCFLRIVLTPAE